MVSNLRLLYFKFGTKKLIDGTNIVKAMDNNEPMPKTINLIKTCQSVPGPAPHQEGA